MQIIIAIVSVIGAAGIIMFLSSVNMNGGVKAAIVTLAVFLAVYCMARVQPKETKPGENTGK